MKYEREGDPIGWEEDEELKKENHAESYVLRLQLEKVSGDVFVYMNAPCPGCAEKLVNSCEIFYYKDENHRSDAIHQINGINNNDNLKLQIDPFTVDDWKIFNHALICRIQNEIKINQVGGL